MNRRLVVSILAMLLVITMILSIVITVIPVRADGAGQTFSEEPAAVQSLTENCN